MASNPLDRQELGEVGAPDGTVTVEIAWIASEILLQGQLQCRRADQAEFHQCILLHVEAPERPIGTRDLIERRESEFELASLETIKQILLDVFVQLKLNQA